ncbi:hypothetical protein BASA62_003619 [Batrachochytrium salamandrivorans]|nr:hypothetical protein BASA62_003619 [Batrachochytrium salamandrivorans]
MAAARPASGNHDEPERLFCPMSLHSAIILLRADFDAIAALCACRLEQYGKVSPFLRFSVHANTCRAHSKCSIHGNCELKSCQQQRRGYSNRINESCDAFIAQQKCANVKSHNRRKHVLIEYVLIADINDSHQVAHQLVTLLSRSR